MNLGTMIDKLYVIYQKEPDVCLGMSDELNACVLEIKSLLDKGELYYVPMKEDISYYKLNKIKFDVFFKPMKPYFKKFDKEFNFILVSLFLRPIEGTKNPHFYMTKNYIGYNGGRIFNNFYKTMWSLLHEYGEDNKDLPTLQEIIFSENHVMKKIMMFSWSLTQFTYSNDETKSDCYDIYHVYLELADFCYRRKYLSDDFFSSLNLYDTSYLDLLSKENQLFLLHRLYYTINSKKFFREQRALFILETQFDPKYYKESSVNKPPLSLYDHTIKISYTKQAYKLFKYLSEDVKEELRAYLKTL